MFPMSHRWHRPLTEIAAFLPNGVRVHKCRPLNPTGDPTTLAREANMTCSITELLECNNNDNDDEVID